MRAWKPRKELKSILSSHQECTVCKTDWHAPAWSTKQKCGEQRVCCCPSLKAPAGLWQRGSWNPCYPASNLGATHHHHSGTLWSTSSGRGLHICMVLKHSKLEALQIRVRYKAHLCICMNPETRSDPEDEISSALSQQVESSHILSVGCQCIIFCCCYPSQLKKINSLAQFCINIAGKWRQGL